jgi:hypothetical protein
VSADSGGLGGRKYLFRGIYSFMFDYYSDSGLRPQNVSGPGA